MFRRTSVLVSVLAVAFALVAPLGASASDLTALDVGVTVGSSSEVDLAGASAGWEVAPPEFAERFTDVADGKGRAPGEVGGGSVGALEARLSDEPCEDGMAGPFPCDNVDLLSFVPLAEMAGTNGNDLWGWTDPETGREYAIMGMGYSTAFIDVTDGTDPVVLGTTPTASARYIPIWRDVKVHDDHAFIVSEHTGHGLQVVDLTRLRDLKGPLPTIIQPDATFDGFSWAHNIAINEDTGFAYVVGTNRCDGGLYMVDINEPLAPSFAGCFGEDEQAGQDAGDGYTHDVQCVTYTGPSGKYRGNEICFASNENSLTIVDVTDKANPVMISRTEYVESAYTHQGWLTADQRWLLFGDELDESRGTVSNTTTYIMDVAKLESPGTPVPYAHETKSIDHNLYIDGRFVYQANYTAGLRVLSYDRKTLKAGQLDEVAFFDVVPNVDVAEYAGAWSNYPYFESGNVIVSTIEGGLFVLRPHLPELDQRSKRMPAI